MTAICETITTLDQLPPEWPEGVRVENRAALARDAAFKLIVLDDDPTGTQTVYDVPVLTEWSPELLRGALRSPDRCCYILTNSRSLPVDEAQALIETLARNLRIAADGRPFHIVSRSDSTLRGHYPLETDVLAAELGPFDATLLVPCFEAGGRCTIGGVHYVATADRLVPCAETPFARDAAFGYRNADLRQWVEEKTGGRVSADAVELIPLETLRGAGPRGVERILHDAPAGAVVVVDAVTRGDLDVVVAALLALERSGRRYLFRTAAEFVAARLALDPQPLVDLRYVLGAINDTTKNASLSPESDFATLASSTIGGEGRGERRADLSLVNGHLSLGDCDSARIAASCNHQMTNDQSPMINHSPIGGLIVAGSYVAATTTQLTWLRKAGGLVSLELDVARLLDDKQRGLEIGAAAEQANAALRRGQDVLVATTRELVAGRDAASSLRIGRAVSDALVTLVQQVQVRPRYVVAKGGITSSDVATRGFNVRTARVLGQVLPGVSLWRLGADARFPDLAYIVFPGNVGKPDALLKLYRLLSPSPGSHACLE